jgi:hypothetical protein
VAGAGIVAVAIGLGLVEAGVKTGVIDGEIGQVAGNKQAYIDYEIRYETENACLAPVHCRFGLLKELFPSVPVTA